MSASISALTQRWHDQNRFTTAQVPHSLLEHVTRLHRKQRRRVSSCSSCKHRMQYRISSGFVIKGFRIACHLVHAYYPCPDLIARPQFYYLLNETWDNYHSGFGPVQVEMQ